MKWPKVSIVVVNWNGLDDTIECIESLLHISYPAYRLITVDNGSHGNDAHILEQRYREQVEVIATNENYGFAGGANVGIRSALKNPDVAYVLLLNNDTIVDPDFLTELVCVAEADNSIGLAGSVIYKDSGEIQYAGQNISWCGGFLLQRKARLDGKSVVNTEFVPGSCMLIRRETLDSVGLLATEYFLECEDTDYCIRVLRAGFRVVCVRTSKIWHKVSKSVYKTSNTFVKYYTRNRILVRAKYATPFLFLCFLINLMFVQLWAYLFVYLIRWRRPDIVSNFLNGFIEGLLMALGCWRRRLSLFFQRVSQ